MPSTIKLDCTFSHARLTELLRPRIQGQHINDNLVVEDITLGADEEWLHADTRVSGSYNGHVDIRYKLGYSTEQERFVLNELHVELTNKGLLARGANWVVQKFFSQKLDEKFEALMNDKFHAMLNDLLEKYSDHTLDNGMSVRASLREMTFADITWDHEHLYCTAIARGSFTLEL